MEKGKFGAFDRTAPHRNLNSVITEEEQQKKSSNLKEGQKFFSVRLDEDFIAEIKAEAALSKLSIQFFTELALREYVAKSKMSRENKKIIDNINIK